MKLKDGFILRDVAGQTVVLPSGKDMDLNMMITLNDTGKFIWQLLETEKTEEELVNAILSEYDVDKVTASVAVSNFIAELKKNEFLTY